MHYLIALLGGLAYGVYLDATKHKIGRVPGDDLVDNHSAGGWAGRALLIAPAIAYLRKRPKLLERAAEHPVEAPHARRNKILILAGLMTAVFLASAGGGSNIDAVRNGILDFNQATTLGEAMENYSAFRSCTWESSTTPNGMDIVLAIGELDLERLKGAEAPLKEKPVGVEAIFAFTVLRDGESFECSGFGLRLTGEDGGVVNVDPEQWAAPLGVRVPAGEVALERVYADEPLF